MDKRYVVLIDAILVLGSLLVIAGFIGYARPLIIAPLDDYTTLDTAVLFTFEKADLILLDDNLQFSSPREIYVEDNIIVNLGPGVYYWKAVGALESEVRQLTVESRVDLKIKDSGTDEYAVVNSGNIPLTVDVYDKGILTGKLTVSVDEEDSAFGDKFIGGSSP